MHTHTHTHTHTDTHTHIYIYIVFNNLKFTLKHLKRYYTFRSSSGSILCSFLKLQFKRLSDLFLNINQLDALSFKISLFQASTCFEHMCSSSGAQNCIIQPLVSPHLYVAVRCTGRPPIGVMIPETV